VRAVIYPENLSRSVTTRPVEPGKNLETDTLKATSCGIPVPGEAPLLHVLGEAFLGSGQLAGALSECAPGTEEFGIDTLLVLIP
jgi:hypothetical protein